MRYIVIGAGAIGGTVGARLFEAGHQVVLVARGAHLAALRSDGLTFSTPTGTRNLRVPAAAGPNDLQLQLGDVLLLSVKLQDAQPVLEDWALQPVVDGRTAGEDLPLFCLQNGVDGERMALRRFARVYGVCVMLPASRLEPGRVSVYSEARTGVLTVGRYPDGVDDVCSRVSADLSSADFDAPVTAQVMRWKYRKLLANLGNALEAIIGSVPDDAEWIVERARSEGRAAFAAAQIDHATAAEEAASLVNWRMAGIPGQERGGGSTWQSLTRGAGSVEVDFLSGEIVLLGRLHGVPTPVNETLQRVADQCARDGIAPGMIGARELNVLITGG